MKQFLKSAIALILCLATILPLASCGKTGHDVSISKDNPGQYWNDIPDAGSNTGDSSVWDKTGEPNINITVIGGDVELPEKEKTLEELAEDNADMYSMVLTAVQADLTLAGFSVAAGVAQSENETGYSAVGLYYVDHQVDLFSSPLISSCGFVEIVSNEDDYQDAFREDALIYVTDADVLENDEQQELFYVYSYNYDNIGSYHFIYHNKYVTYYQETEMRVKYSAQENLKENYDLSLGSIYNYDTKSYVYDESIFGEYSTHSGETLFSNADYEQLELLLKKQVEDQEKAGYIVNEFNIVYISPEAIQTYLLSDEEDTFFGYSVSALTETFGLGTALSFTENGFEPSKIIEPTDENYNWKSFLIKCGIGCGIILVGAILTPITGGAAFGCALLTISKFAVTFALTSGLGTLAIETVSGLISGKSLVDSLEDATYKGLDSFANGFMIGAAIGSIGVVSGIIKPTACFVAGTPILIDCTNGNYSFKAIENIGVGDYVLSYNENTGLTEKKRVSEIYVNEVDQIVEISFGEIALHSTLNHPFYSKDRDGWVKACDLVIGEKVLSALGEVTVSGKKNLSCDSTKVYNFTVEGNHTYFVGQFCACVHNECTTLQSKRNKAVTDAWKQEKQNVLNGTSKYNWSPAEKAQLLKTGKVKGYAGHHIKPVNELVGTAKESLISSADDIVFLSDKAHKYVHAVGDSFEATIPRVLEIVPWIAERLPLLA